jgi:hypothetical protein
MPALCKAGSLRRSGLLLSCFEERLSIGAAETLTGAAAISAARKTANVHVHGERILTLLLFCMNNTLTQKTTEQWRPG